MNLFEFDKNKGIVIGTDEAGRGPAAGGVFAASVYFEDVTDGLMHDLAKLNDSKKLPDKVRNELFNVILDASINSVICIEVEEIERFNVLNGALKAMKLSCEEVVAKAGLTEFVTLVDGTNKIRDYKYSQETVVKGDCKSACIAAASILAKVSRDRYMEELALEFPQYGWDTNYGYLTSEHIAAIDEYGLCKYHRASFLERHFHQQLTLF